MQQVHFEPWIQVAVSEVLESMCFLSLDSGAANEQLMEAQPWVGRCLDFRGPLQGQFGLRAPLRTARVLASNFLGEEPGEISDEQAGEVLGEVANMVCGTLLSSIEAHHSFDLTPPRPEDGMHSPSPHRIARTFALDEGELLVWLEV